MDFLWLTLALFLLAVLLFAVYIVYMSAQHGVFKKLGIPGPAPVPLLGNLHQQMSQGSFNFQVNMYNKYANSKAYGVYDVHVPTLWVRDLDMIRDICVKNFNSFVDHRTFDFPEPLDRTLTNLTGDSWKNVRATVSPAFSTAKLKRMFQHIVRNARCLTENLCEKQAAGEAVELKHLISCFTMDVIASTGFGAQIDSLKNEENDFMKRSKSVVGRMMRIIMLTLFLPFLTKPLNRLGYGLLAQDEIAFFNGFVEEVMKGRKEAQSMIFLIAGFDTVSTVLSFALFLLAQNPECCACLQQEIDDKLGNGVPTYDNMQEMPYMDLIVNEVTRLYPPGLQIDRVCTQDTEIHGVRIPKGMVLNFPVYAIHRDPAIWVDPETFDPERFSPERKLKRHPYAHMPFRQGPRSCVGMRLALLEIKVALATVLQEMTPVVCSKTVFPVKLKFFQTHAEDGLWVKFESREGN